MDTSTSTLTAASKTIKELVDPLGKVRSAIASFSILSPGVLPNAGSRLDWGKRVWYFFKKCSRRMQVKLSMMVSSTRSVGATYFELSQANVDVLF